MFTFYYFKFTLAINYSYYDTWKELLKTAFESSYCAVANKF